MAGVGVAATTGTSGRSAGARIGAFGARLIRPFRGDHVDRRRFSPLLEVLHAWFQDRRRDAR